VDRRTCRRPTEANYAMTFTEPLPVRPVEATALARSSLSPSRSGAPAASAASGLAAAVIGWNAWGDETPPIAEMLMYVLLPWIDVLLSSAADATSPSE
jgi:hypothetical protein